MYFLGWNPTIALRILFCVTRHGAESISFYVYSIRFWSAASGQRRRRHLATWRTFKKVDKANRYGARSGCRRGSQLSATASEEGRLFSGIAHNAAAGGRERESHLVGRRRSISSSSCKEHGEANAGDCALPRSLSDAARPPRRCRRQSPPTPPLAALARRTNPGGCAPLRWEAGLLYGGTGGAMRYCCTAVFISNP